MKPYILYVPGLADRVLSAQRHLMKPYRWFGAEAEMFPMNWSDDEPYAAKQARLIARLQVLANEGKRVSLLSFSGGGSAAVNAYVAAPGLIRSMVFISGKLSGTVDDKYYDQNPAFRDSMKALEHSLTVLTADDKSKMVSIGSPFDPVVPLRDATIPGVRSRTIFSAGHAWTLIAATVVYGRFIVRFMKQHS